MNKLNSYEVTKYDLKKRIVELEKNVEELKSKINEDSKKLINKDLELNKILNSKSWKVTKPIRTFLTNISNIKSKNKINVQKKKYVLGVDYKDWNPYDSFYQENKDYSNFETDIKAIAFYLPQFHTFKENDQWWGKGFTEWTNTKKSQPRFEGHYQPREPHNDIGYYKLDNIETIKKQIFLAKQHGIYGFCFYYYWFSGKRLMDKPVDLLYEHKEIDFPYCFCWANENWTRTWDGLNKNVLIKQEYSDKDPYEFIKSLKKYFDDKRYIRVDGKPLLLIYNPVEIPNFRQTVKAWRDAAQKLGIGEIEIISKNYLSNSDFTNQEFVDGEFDFAPHGIGHPSSRVLGLETEMAYNYQIIVDDIEHLYREHFTPKPFYYSCTMGWDNAARRKDNYKIYYAYTPKSFYKWLRIIIEETRYRNPKDKRFIFINAWNEWAEGTYLEPDKKYGYTNINTVSKAVFDLPFDENVKIITDNTQKIRILNKKIAIQAHIFYLELIPEIIDNLKQMPYEYDLFVSTDSKEKAKEIKKAFKEILPNIKVIVEVYDNIGRDVAPFIFQMKKRIKNYDYICHIHTKKSTNDTYDDEWRKYLYHNLFGSKNNIKAIFNLFEKDEKLGIIYPETYSGISHMIGIGGNKEILENLLKSLDIEKYDLSNFYFPSGTMFWAKTRAIDILFENADQLSFPKEEGQIDATLQHAIERSICIIADNQGFTSQKIINKCKE